MKITVVYQYFGTKKSGWSTRFYDFALEWIKQGHKVRVITSPYYKSDLSTKKLLSRRVIDEIEILVINSPDSNLFSFSKRVINAITFSIISSFVILFDRSDKIIFSSGPILILFPFLIKRVFKKNGMIIEHRDLWPDGAIEMGILKGKKAIIAEKFVNFCNSKAEIVVGCSVGMVDILRKRGLKQVFNIPHGCDTSLLDLYQGNVLPEWHKGAKILIYSGSLGIMDAVEDVILGFINAKLDCNCHLIILGSGVEKKRLYELSRLSDKSSNIHFLGLVSKTIMAEWYKVAHVSFVVFKNFPVLSTSSPNKLFDSITFGVPIIQNTSGWIYDFIIDKNIGYNVEVNNIPTMVTAIENSIQNESEYKIKKKNIGKLAFGELNRTKISNKYLAIMTKIETNKVFS